MTTPAPSFAAISRVVFQPWSVRITVSMFCFKSAISASCFPGFTFSRLIKITESSDMSYLLSVSDPPKDERKGGNGARRRRFLGKSSRRSVLLLWFVADRRNCENARGLPVLLPVNGRVFVSGILDYDEI